MKNRLLIASLMMLLPTLTLKGDQITAFTINTSSIAGMLGSVDFQFNPGPLGSQPATVQILSFSGGVYGGTQMRSGADIGGPVGSAPITLSNSSPLNEDFEWFNFGNSISFVLDFGGPAVNSPDHSSGSGSTFAFSMFLNRAGTIPALTPDSNGYAGIVNVNPGGSITITPISPELQVAPEPGTFCLAGVLLATLGGASLLRRRRSMTV